MPYLPTNLLHILRSELQPPSDDSEVNNAVAMIFRINPKHTLELLFVQRASNPKDRYSADVCFPGGRR
jgi:8-oxo-dGTP pyrophosphatase MutT (NUDIX family)